MVEIVKIGKEHVPALRFIGKKYGNEDRVDGLFSTKWDDWFNNGWFEQLKKLEPLDGWRHYIGLMGHENGVFKYWIVAIDCSKKGLKCLTKSLYALNVNLGVIAPTMQI